MAVDVVGLLTQNGTELQNLLQKIRLTPALITLGREMQTAVATIGARLTVIRDIILPALHLASHIDLEFREQDEAIRECLAELLTARSQSDVDREFRVLESRLSQYEQMLTDIAKPILRHMPTPDRHSLGVLSRLLLEQFLGPADARYIDCSPMFVSREGLDHGQGSIGGRR